MNDNQEKNNTYAESNENERLHDIFPFSNNDRSWIMGSSNQEKSEIDCCVCGDANLEKIIWMPENSENIDIIEEISYCNKCFSKAMNLTYLKEGRIPRYGSPELPTVVSFRDIDFTDCSPEQKIILMKLIVLYFAEKLEELDSNCRSYECTSENCSNIILNLGVEETSEESDNEPVIICEDCNKKTCAVCDIDYESGHKCGSQKSQHFKKRFYGGGRACYHCGAVTIIKNGGCQHMECPLCKKEFHWGFFRNSDYKPNI